MVLDSCLAKVPTALYSIFEDTFHYVFPLRMLNFQAQGSDGWRAEDLWGLEMLGALRDSGFLGLEQQRDWGAGELGC